MKTINESIVLEHYIKLMHDDKIVFLIKHKSLYSEIEELMKVLRHHTSMNKKIQAAKKLWKILFRTAMSYIDPDQRGYDELFKFFDEYVEFEELIFASDSYYRDHTLHCLWVYFLGVYLRSSEEFNEIINISEHNNQYIGFFKYICKHHQNHNKISIIQQITDMLTTQLELEQSIFCVASLTHDLGYPIKKIHKINKSIKNILPYFGVKNYDEFNFNYTAIQQHFIERYISMLSIEANFDLTIKNSSSKQEVFEEIMRKIIRKNAVGESYIDIDCFETLNAEEKNMVIDSIDASRKEFTDYPTEIRYSDDIEQYQHGIMSGFLLTKIVHSFKNMELVLNNDKTDINIHANSNYARFSTKQSILRAISDHTSSGYRIASIRKHSELLTFVDEVEEFSRITRANQNREFINEFCKTELYVEDGYFYINFIFNNSEIDGLDPEFAFKGRCKKTLTLFDIENLDPRLKIRMSCIGDLPYDQNKYTIEIRNKFAKITINDEEKHIPRYLKSNNFMTREAYENM